MTCTHKHYKQGGYLTANNAIRAMRANKICWMGRIIDKCSKCGTDISYANVVKVKTAEEYLKEFSK